MKIKSMRGKTDSLTNTNPQFVFQFRSNSQLCRMWYETLYEMVYYCAGLLVVIVLWFLVIVIFSEQIRKSIFADFFTLQHIRLLKDSWFLIPKHHQLKEFSELNTGTSVGELVWFH